MATSPCFQYSCVLGASEGQRVAPAFLRIPLFLLKEVESTLRAESIERGLDLLYVFRLSLRGEKWIVSLQSVIILSLVQSNRIKISVRFLTLRKSEMFSPRMNAL